MSGEGAKPARPVVMRPIPAIGRPPQREAPARAEPPKAAPPEEPARPAWKDATRRTVAARPTMEDVRACYRLLLGREPEDEAVLQRHLARADSVGALVDGFLASAEFTARRRDAPRQALPLDIRRLAVEVAATPAELAAMLERIGQYWEEAGREMPHWSVLTEDRYRPEAIEASIDEFYASGRRDAALVEGLLERQGIPPESLPSAVEYGCGVGRATLALARLFDRVTGCDISRPHLALAAEQAEARIVDNVAWHHSTTAAPMPGDGWDFWFSRLVLQHNPPPVAAHLLRLAFAGLRPGGVAMFQVPTHRTDYAFSIRGYLEAGASRAPEMEMHVLPQGEVFALAREAGLEVLEVRDDTHVVAPASRIWMSNLFVFRRPAG